MLVDSQQSDVDRLSWNAIEAFDHAESGLEHLVKTVQYRQERKSNLYSLIVSIAIVFAVFYIVAGIVSAASPRPQQVVEQQGDEMSLLLLQQDTLAESEDEIVFSPKFLTPIFQP